MNAAKRRRLNESTSTLSRPFKSPMRVDVKQRLSADNNKTQASPLSTTTSTDEPASSPASSKISSSPGPSLPAPAQNRPTLSSPTRPTHSRPRPPSSLNQPRDPEYLSLQKQHSALLLELSQLRASLDTSQQAVKISSNTTDHELEMLISKWKTASREAAEELFRGAKDRVNKMGGVGAWRERTQKQNQGGWGDDGAEETNEDGSELTPAQREAREIMLEDMKAEMEKYGGAKKEEIVEEKDDQSFTMDMMLKQLNVELDVIGYDKASQRWI